MTTHRGSYSSGVKVYWAIVAHGFVTSTDRKSRARMQGAMIANNMKHYRAKPSVRFTQL